MTNHEPESGPRKALTVNKMKFKNNRRNGRRKGGQKRIFDNDFFAHPTNIMCTLFVVVSMIFGGGPGTFGLQFLVVSVTGLILLIASVRGAGLRKFQSLPLIVRLAIAAAIALPFVQIIPLPPIIWSQLPGQDLRREVMLAYGLGGAWLPLSLTPADTAYSAVIGLAMLGVFMTVLAMSRDALRGLVGVVLAVIGLGIFVGLVQYSGGGEALQFYKVSHRDALIGFFANKNHMGLTLACFVPLTFILIEPHATERPGWIVLLGLGWAATAALLIATNSRAGLLLGFLAMVLASLRLFKRQYKRVLLGAGVTSMLAVALATYVPVIRDIVERLGQTGQDVRINILEQGLPLIQQYGLLGSGLGSFASVYSPTEKLIWVNRFFVNHLHNDWLQLLIEAGVPGIVVLALFGAALALAVRAIWFASATGRNALTASLPNDRSFAWAGMVIIVLFAAHSVGDYPVRRVGTLVLLVIALAWVFRTLVQHERPVRNAN